MRIDLEHGGRRPWYVAMGLALVKLVVGVKPGPPLALSYRPDLLPREFIKYVVRGMSYQGSWSKGESELFAAFVSDLNTCHF